MRTGGIAEEKFTPGGRTSGWSSDKEKASKYAETAVTKYGLTDQALQLPVEDGKVVVNSPETQAEIRSLLEAGEKYARQRIDENLPAIRTTAARLYKKGSLDRAEFETILSSSPKARARTGSVC
jgi:ATP-dependent Zn protease